MLYLFNMSDTPAQDFPRMSINTMVDYLTASGAHQRFTVIQNMKNQLGRRSFAPYYQESRSAIRNYHSGDSSAIDESIKKLLRAQTDAPRALDASKIENNLRVLTDGVVA